jgi:LytS/YehU family sensor histidine kinase
MPQLRGEASTLGRECALAVAYLRIVQAHMGTRLEYALEVPPELGSARFPPMLLLPLIDNAIRHSLAPLPLVGRIDVRATECLDRIRLVVSDNGLGDCISRREGPGLTALRERLAGLYGADATLDLSPTEPYGLTATIEVPRYEGASDRR